MPMNPFPDPAPALRAFPLLPERHLVIEADAAAEPRTLTQRLPVWDERARKMGFPPTTR
jgi:hypothetical protein